MRQIIKRFADCDNGGEALTKPAQSRNQVIAISLWQFRQDFVGKN